MKYGLTMLKILDSKLSIHDWITTHFDEAELLLRAESRGLGGEAIARLEYESRWVKGDLRTHIHKDITAGRYSLKNGKFCCIPHGVPVTPIRRKCKHCEANK